MLPTPVKTTNTSIYDSLPNLDSWYAKKEEERINQIVPCHKQRTAVSFSSAPPAVYRYQERPTHHRRTSSSEHGKLFNFYL